MRRLAAFVSGAVGITTALATAGATVESSPTPIHHVVVIYQENHSYDNVLGAWCNQNPSRGCDGPPASVHLRDGAVVALTRAPDVVPAVNHGVTDQLTAMDGGRMDGWDRVTGCTPTVTIAGAIPHGCLTEYAPDQIPNLAALAGRFAISDRTFSMADSPSWGGHLYAVAGSLDGFIGNNPVPHVLNGAGWGCDSGKSAVWVRPTGALATVPACIPDPALNPQLYPHGGAFAATPVPYVPTIMDRLNAAGLTWRMYTAPRGTASYNWATCPSFAECLDTPQHAGMVRASQVLTDARNGTLPSFSLVLPGATGGNTSQHNGSSMLTGDNWIGQVVGAIENGPDWASTAIFITYDDCGCFYDHVPPPVNPDGTRQGPRVPMVIVSPYARAGYTDTTPTTFAGILAYTEHTLGLSALSPNDAGAYDFHNSFDYTQTPIRGPRMVVRAVPPEATWDPGDDPT